VPEIRKIDCVMLPVADLEHGVAVYTAAFGLHEVWRVGSAVALGMLDSDAEVVLHTLDIPSEFGVHYLVDDVRGPVPDGFTVRLAPFPVETGWCTVLDDPFGNPICLIDMSSGQRR
jgi:catechol 2,3-dioxygenase-like lactoylglutathione lyase family enzyme